MRWNKSFLIVGGLLSASAFALEPAAPTTRPADDPDALVRQLADESYVIRQNAYFRLRGLGSAALPALREAVRSENTEVHVRAQELLGELQMLPVPHDLPEPPVPGNGGFYNNAVHTEIRGGVRIVDVNDNGRLIHIEQYPSRLRMVVSGQIEGEPVTREYVVNSVEDLRLSNRDAYELYRSSLRASMEMPSARLPNFGQAQGRGMLVAPGMRGGFMQIIPPPQQRPANDDLDRLEKQLTDQMRRSNVAAAEQNRVLDLLRQLRTVQPRAIDPAQVNQRMQEYNRRSDALRQQLRDLKLDDPGAALPPPDSARLGISVTEELIAGKGIVVTHILPDSRAEKLGLREEDSIQKINGKPIHSAQELRTAVTEAPKGLVIEGERKGQPLKLEEARKN